jgi:hypothetical protein
MSLQDVLANVIYDSPNPGDIAAIEASLASIYGTLEGRVMLDLSVSSGRHLIFRNNEGGGNSAELGSQVVRYDLPGVADVSFISSKGNIVQYPIAAALPHSSPMQRSGADCRSHEMPLCFLEAHEQQRRLPMSSRDA